MVYRGVGDIENFGGKKKSELRVTSRDTVTGGLREIALKKLRLMKTEIPKENLPPAMAPESVAKIAPTDPCKNCGHGKWWTPRGRQDWRCETCQPSPSPALVGERISTEPEPVSVVAEDILNACWPMCSVCGCQWYVETAMSDGEIFRRCWMKGCQGEIGNDPVSMEPPVFKPMTVPGS